MIANRIMNTVVLVHVLVFETFNVIEAHWDFFVDTTPFEGVPKSDLAYTNGSCSNLNVVFFFSDRLS